jgi:hypothetical protein
MKKLILLLLGIAIGFGICYFYFNNQSNTESMTKPPKGIITPAEAIVLDKAFNTRHQLISDSIVKRLDNRSSWWSLADMRAYLDYAEAQTKDLGYTMDGVRMYLGAHPNDAQGVGLTTVFMVPTGEKSLAEGSMINTMHPGHSHDIPGGNGMNDGGQGIPPSANYPQN